MILAGQLLLNDEANPGQVRLASGYLRLDGEVIAEVVEGEVPGNIDAGGSGCLICPGFIDAHLHLPQFDTMGAHGLPLLRWLDEVTFPAERKWEDADYAAGMTRRVVRQLLAHGTTAICAYATVHHDGTLAALDTAREMGMRGLIGQTLIDRNAPGFLSRPMDQLIDETADLLDRYPTGGRLAAAVTPRFAVSCTPELLAAAGALAEQRSAYVQSHLAETIPECELIAELFPGRSYVQAYEDTGLLTERSIYGHGIYLNEADRQALSDAQATVAHCPTANSFLRSGTMNRISLITDDVRVAVGSDIGGGYERSMVRVARAMVEAASTLGEHYPSAAEAWWHITAGNADALGWRGAGRLSVGAPADLLVIEPDIAWLVASVAPLDMLLWAWDDRWVKRTLLQGAVAYAAG